MLWQEVGVVLYTDTFYLINKYL